MLCKITKFPEFQNRKILKLSFCGNYLKNASEAVFFLWKLEIMLSLSRFWKAFSNYFFAEDKVPQGEQTFLFWQFASLPKNGRWFGKMDRMFGNQRIIFDQNTSKMFQKFLVKFCGTVEYKWHILTLFICIWKKWFFCFAAKLITNGEILLHKFIYFYFAFVLITEERRKIN